MNISNVEIGAGQPCRFVAEISNNHNGDLPRALNLIHAAKDAGADFVKFQCYTADELVALRGDGPAPEPWASQGYSMAVLYAKAATPLAWFPELFAFARHIGIVPFSSVFGPESLAVLEGVGCPAYKIASLDNDAEVLAMAVERIGKPIIVSEATQGESAIIAGDLAYLYCPPGYPQTQFGFSNDHGANPFGPTQQFDGFSYHGTDPLPCIVAATLGAKIIEFHFQLDHTPDCALNRPGRSPVWPSVCDCGEPSELEGNVSLFASQTREMIETVRKIEGML